MTLLQLAGTEPEALVFSLPAATTTTDPASVAALMASCIKPGQLPAPPRDILITSAGLLLVGSPATGKPADHRTPSAISESDPPQVPSTRTGTCFA